MCGGKSRLKIWIFASVSCQNRKSITDVCQLGQDGCFNNNNGKSFFFAVSIHDDAFTTAIYSMAPCTTITFWELVNSFLYPIPCIGYWHNDFYSVSLHMHVNIPIQSFNSPTDGVLCKMQWHFIVLLFRFCLNMER